MGTSGSEGGQQKPTSRKTGRALLSDPYTYVATWSGCVYVAFVFDVFSRRIVGWRTATSMTHRAGLDASRRRCGPAPTPAHRPDRAGTPHR